MTGAFDPTLLLFVPGDRPDRFGKALASAASGAILDLEDAVAPDRKAEARATVVAFLAAQSDRSRIVVRVNPPASPWGLDDGQALRDHPPAAVVLPKASHPDDVGAIARALPNVPIVALIETARGVLHAGAIAAADGVAALAFGPYDLAAELGGSSGWEAMIAHRSHVLVAARAADRWAIDGPTIRYADPEEPAADARAARALGYDGKLLIHPAQIDPVRGAFQPSADEVAYARRVVDAAAKATPAVVDGTMIDQPILTAAERVLRRAGHEPSRYPGE